MLIYASLPHFCSLCFYCIKPFSAFCHDIKSNLGLCDLITHSASQRRQAILRMQRVFPFCRIHIYFVVILKIFVLVWRRAQSWNSPCGWPKDFSTTSGGSSLWSFPRSTKRGGGPCSAQTPTWWTCTKWGPTSTALAPSSCILTVRRTRTFPSRSCRQVWVMWKLWHCPRVRGRLWLPPDGPVTQGRVEHTQLMYYLDSRSAYS